MPEFRMHSRVVADREHTLIAAERGHSCSYLHR
jgi:hypothetical protein